MNPLQFLLIAGLQAYRWLISPAKNLLFGTAGCCRFTPTCSQYSLEAIRRHGAGRGAWMSVRRVCRCHPWGGAGTDPVPDLLRLPS